MSLYEKMFNVMNDSEAIEKNMEVGTGKNAYKAVSEATILNMIKPLFKQYKLIIFPISGEIKDHCSTWDKTDYDGKTSQTLRAMTELKVIYRIVDVESREFQDVIGFGNGADSQDKGAGKAFTYSLKNVLSKTFMLFSGEDTDNEHSDDIGILHQPSLQSQPKPQGQPQNDGLYYCEDCNGIIGPTAKKTLEQILEGSQHFYKKNLCQRCISKRYVKDHPEVKK